MDRRPHAKPADRDLKTTLGCLFLMGFEGTTVTPQIRSLIKDYRLGAVLLNATNFVSAEQAVTLIRELQITAHNARHQYPLLIAVDQENGLVKSVTDPRWITQFPSSLGIAATRSTNNAYQLALATGRELSCLGINWILGPALDVVLDRDVPGFGSRSFGDDPEEVAKLGGAFIRGFRDGGVASGAKHFPLGGSLKFDESSTTVPVVFETLEQLRQKVLIPFQEAIKERVDSVMAAGCAISSIGPKFMHACFSRKVVTDLLRHQLGYEGVAVSECLEMESIANHIGVGQATVMGVHAGCDILTICQSLPLQLEAFASLSLALENGALSWDLVQKSVDRVIRLRSTHTSWSHALNPPGLPQLAATRPRHMTLASRIYEESITLVRDDHGYIPLSNVLSDNSTLLILSPILHHRDGGLRSNHQHQESNFPTGEGLQYGEDYFQDFGRAMACYNLGAVLHTSYTSHGVRSEHERLIQKADAIIVLVADANRNQYQLGFAKHVAAISKLQQRTGANPVMEKVLILVSLSSAYDIPADAPFPAHLCTYDSSTIALHCLARVLGGDFKPTGRIPGPQSYPGTQHSHDIVHQQAWLVERFDIARDQVPFRQFLGRLMEADEDSPVISDEHDYVVAIASAGLHPNHGSPDTQHFVIRNTSTGAIYGFASAIRFPELRRGCLGALLVDPEKRELSMGRDLHTSVVRHILQVPGIDSIQIVQHSLRNWAGT
ncbi:Glycoside hydrolase family 3 protein [Pleurostoma richardsiae]|uniref:Glycoside hydrolase family 3 protein n=1 Tax=Pleurostoma richardsiae TaxID=41990 RepID=A0AA38VV22_9PEZI|nr:Glycoside hydrolase family 3 protein [Pleurostoma richardsiae]